MTKIAILGAGNIGQAIAYVLKEKKSIVVDIWDKDPKKSPGQKNLGELVGGADVIFLCMPSFAIPTCIKDISPYLNNQKILINLAKGIEAKTGKTVDSLLLEILPKGQRFVILSGPMLATDLSSGSNGKAVAASISKSALQKVEEIFKKTNLTIETSRDPRGIALAGVLKNVYAVILGATEGMGLGWNAKGIISASAIREMGFIIPKLGGKKGSELTPAGLADMIATGFSPNSRNHQLGVSLASGVAGPSDSEGMNSLPFILKEMKKYKKEIPLLFVAGEFIKNVENGKKELKKFVAR